MADFSEVSSSLSNTDSSTPSVAFCFLGGGAEVAFRRGDFHLDAAAFPRGDFLFKDSAVCLGERPSIVPHTPRRVTVYDRARPAGCLYLQAITHLSQIAFVHAGSADPTENTFPERPGTLTTLKAKRPEFWQDRIDFIPQSHSPHLLRDTKTTSGRNRAHGSHAYTQASRWIEFRVYDIRSQYMPLH